MVYVAPSYQVLQLSDVSPVQVGFVKSSGTHVPADVAVQPTRAARVPVPGSVGQAEHAVHVECQNSSLSLYVPALHGEQEPWS